MKHPYVFPFYIIIVNYNTKNLLRNCLTSIFEKTSDVLYEVIISDNGSTDGSIEMIKKDFPQVMLIENKSNLGFGRANNIARKKASGKYVFYLNSDTVLINNAVKLFYDYWELSTKNIGALGTQLLDQNLENNYSYGFFPSYLRSFVLLINFILDSINLKTIFRKFRKSKKISSYFGEVDYIIGADLFMKNNELADFDEQFFLYYEETDLQYNLSQNGYSRLLIEGPKIIHLSGASDDNIKKRYSFRKLSSIYGWDSCLKYLKKNNNIKILYWVFRILIKCIYCLPQNIMFYKKNKMKVTF